MKFHIYYSSGKKKKPLNYFILFVYYKSILRNVVTIYLEVIFFLHENKENVILSLNFDTSEILCVMPFLG